MMSPLLQLRWLTPLCGVLWLANAPFVRAQDVTDAPAMEMEVLNTREARPAEEYPAPPKTPEIAGEQFYSLLVGVDLANKRDEAARNRNEFQESSQIARSYYGLGSLSRIQTEEISKVSVTRIRNLLTVLAFLKDQPQFVGVITGKEGEQTLVEVSPAPGKKREVVTIAEDGGFRVDVKATYGRWNDLSGDKLDVEWYKITGVAGPELLKNPEFVSARANAQRSSCQSNLKQQMLGILQYAQDYDGHYPPAAKWIDEIMPYVKSETIFQCPSLEPGQKYGYALNQNLGGINQGAIGASAQTVAIYETDDLTRNAYGVQDERAYRHGGGSNIAFADGHIKWFAEGKEDKAAVQFTP